MTEWTLGLLFGGEYGKPFQAPLPSCPWVRATMATSRLDCPCGQSDFLPPACLFPLAGHHPTISASESHTVATPNPESLQPLGPERCPIHEMPFHPQTLQTVFHTSQLSFFSLPPTATPTRRFLLPPAFTELFGTALDWSQLQSNCWLQRNLPSKGKAHTFAEVSWFAFLFE